METLNVDDMENINWNSTYEGPKRMKFIIPIKELTEEEKIKTLKRLKELYSKELKLDNDDTSRVQNCRK